MANQQFSLVWNSFPTNLSSGLYTLLNDEQLVDVTLAADGQMLQAHKLILSVCSTYFRDLFKANTCKHPIVILKDMNYRDVSAILRFMYQGEVNIKQEDLASFLKVAETLQIKGLTKDKNQQNQSENDSKFVNNVGQPDFPGDVVANAFASSEAAPARDKYVTDTKSSASLYDASSSREAFDYAEPESCRDNGLGERDAKKEPDRITHELFDGSTNVGEPVVEPLDYTSDTTSFGKTKSEPADYASDMDVDPRCNRSENAREDSSLLRGNNCQIENHSLTNDFIAPNSASMTFNSGGAMPYDHLDPAFRPDFSYESGSYAKSRKSSKGDPGSNLSLETTLRVVSELGPTVRVERGKVIRMYSCPWCLRHFTRKENLKLHVRYIHGPLESLTCKLCGNKYKNSNSLRVHSYLYHNAKRNKRVKPPLVTVSK